jgi:hypothetical protein
VIEEQLFAGVADWIEPGSFQVQIAGGVSLEEIWEGVKRLVSFPLDMAKWLWDRFLDLITTVNTGVSQVYTAVINQVEWAVESLKNAVGDAYHWVWDAAGSVINFVQGIPATISQLVGQVFSWLWDSASSIVSQVAGFIGQVPGWLFAVAGSIVSQVGSFIGQLPGLLLAGFNFVANIVATVAAQVFKWLWDIAAWVDRQTGGHVGRILERLEHLGTQVIEQAPQIIVQGAAAIGEGFLEGLKFLVEHAFEPFVPAFLYRDTILRKMLAAGYNSAEEIFDDHAPSGVGGSIVRMLEDAIGTIAEIVPLFAGIGTVYAAENVQRAQLKLAPTLPNLGDLQEAYLRDLLPVTEHDAYLGRLGFSPRLIETFKALYYQVAPPTDLVRFAVREVFTPEIAQSFGQFEDFPTAALPDARKAGIDEQLLRNYWAAHWELPSASQGFEMFHRGIIDFQTLELLLRAQDVMPFWRDKLIQIAYNVPGRIDLRRMFAAGVIDEPRTLKGYQDLGYNPEDARVLTDFAKKQAAGHDKALPRGTITLAYRDGLLDRGAATDELHALGFHDDDVDLYLSLEDYHNAKVDSDLAESIVEHDLKAGFIDEGSARGQLAALGVTGRRVELLVRRWRHTAAVRTSTLSAQQVLRALREDVLTEGAARGRLLALGYPEADIPILLELATPEPAPKEPPELTVAQLKQALSAHVIDDTEYRRRLSRKGFSTVDIDILDQLAQPAVPNTEPPELTKAELIAATKARVITVDELVTRLERKGYEDDDIDILLRTQKLLTAPATG